MNIEQLKKLLGREKALPEHEQDLELIASLEAQIAALEEKVEEETEEVEEIVEEETTEVEKTVEEDREDDKKLSALEAKLDKLLAKKEDSEKPKAKKAEPKESATDLAIFEVQKELILIREGVPEAVQELIPADYTPAQLKAYLKGPAYKGLREKLDAPKRPIDPVPKGKIPSGTKETKPPAPKKWNDIKASDLTAFDVIFSGEL